MMDLETIKSTNEERASQARKENIKPFVIESQDQINSFKGFPFPHVGDHVPEGWKLIETYFVDASGFGRVGEGALTVRQFLQKLKVGFGYAVVEAGQFQVYVGEFEGVK